MEYEQPKEGSMAVLQSPTKVLLLDSLNLLLREFQDLFAEPHSLPPQRALNYSVYLKPNSLPVNLRAYRYSPIQKAEIEKQVSSMLSTSIIRPSQSPFASLVLLVKKTKKMGPRGFVLTVVNSMPTPSKTSSVYPSLMTF